MKSGDFFLLCQYPHQPPPPPPSKSQSADPPPSSSRKTDLGPPSFYKHLRQVGFERLMKTQPVGTMMYLKMHKFLDLGKIHL